MEKILYLEIITDSPNDVVKVLVNAGYLVRVRRWSDDIGELLKSLVSPFVVVTSWATLLIMWVNQIPAPAVLVGIGAAITGGFGLERGVKQWRGRASKIK